MRKITLILLAIASFAACTKNDTANSLPTVSSSDSTIVLIAAANKSFGTYVSNPLMVQYLAGSNPYRFYTDEKMPTYAYFNNGKIDHLILVDTVSPISSSKRSLIFLYGSNGKCSKILYKSAPYNLSNNSPYFTDINDGALSTLRDSLIYTPTNQLSAIYEAGDPNSSTSIQRPYNSIVKFY